MVGPKRINSKDYVSLFVVVQKQPQCSNLHLNGWWKKGNAMSIQVSYQSFAISRLSLEYFPF